MSRRRTRIQPGPGSLIYTVVTGVILATGLYTQANLLLGAFGLMAGALVVSLVVAVLALRKVEIQRLAPNHGVAGDLLVIRYRLVNHSWLPQFSVIVQESWGRGSRGWKRTGPIADPAPQLRDRPTGWLLHLGPRQTVQVEAPCTPLRRGVLGFEKIVLSTSFPFGLVRKIATCYEPAGVLVYPHLYRIHRRLLYSLSHHDAAGRKQLERSGGTEEFLGLRPYRTGDSLRLIAWKRVARTGELVTREMTQANPPRLLLLLDLRQRATPTTHPAAPDRDPPDPSDTDHHPSLSGTEQALEQAITLTASLICEAHFQGYQVGLATAGVDGAAYPVHHSLPHRQRILEALARLDLHASPATVGQVPARPSVIVRPHEGERASPPPGGQRTIVLGAADLKRYVNEADSQGQALLDRRPRVQGKHADLEKRGNKE